MEELVKRMYKQINYILEANPCYTERDFNNTRYAMTTALVPVFVAGKITEEEYDTLFKIIWDRNNWVLDLSDKEVVDA